MQGMITGDESLIPPGKRKKRRTRMSRTVLAQGIFPAFSPVCMNLPNFWFVVWCVCCFSSSLVQVQYFRAMSHHQ